jgi:ABC-type sugar transport system permease subunit
MAGRTLAMSRSRGGTLDGRSFSTTFLVPAVFLTLLFTIYPLVRSLALTFEDWNGAAAPKFIGLANLQRLVGDAEARDALIRTLVFAFGTTAGNTIIGTALALAIDRGIPFGGALRFLIFLPVVLPATFISLAWRYALDPTFGWLNNLLGAINPALDHSWLTNRNEALWVAMIIVITQYVGVTMILVLAGLRSIPQDIREAAAIDGATGFAQARHITLPLSRNVLIAVTSISLVANFKTFDTIWALTQGGPGRATDVVSTFIYRTAFGVNRFGYGSAAAFVATFVIVAISLAYTFRFRPDQMSRL